RVVLGLLAERDPHGARGLVDLLREARVDRLADDDGRRAGRALFGEGVLDLLVGDELLARIGVPDEEPDLILGGEARVARVAPGHRCRRLLGSAASARSAGPGGLTRSAGFSSSASSSAMRDRACSSSVCSSAVRARACSSSAFIASPPARTWSSSTSSSAM